MPIPAYSRGQPITAASLNRLVTGVNSLETLLLPRTVQQPPLAAGVTDSIKSDATPPGAAWVEVGRVTSTQRITNPEDETQYVDVARAERVTFAPPSGERITLYLRN